MVDEADAKPTEEKPQPPEVEEKSVSKQYQGTFGDREVSYTATAATVAVGSSDDRRAAFFFVSYTEDDTDPATRPIVFAFNGGPGSSTVWLHLGLLGPKRVELDDEGFSVRLPGRLIDNEHSILDVADVVLIDAVGTGFSTAEPKDKEKDYHHFARDIEAFTEFIVTYLNRYRRWASPKYLAGESYGTTRGAAIAKELFNPHGVELNGIVLISVALSFQTIASEEGTRVFHPGNELPFPLHLPTYAATAWYHGRLSENHQKRPLRDLLDEVEQFALGQYWTALAHGDQLPSEERAAVVSKLSEYTGLSETYIDRYDMRIHIMRFCKELLRDRRRTVGRLDSRYTGIDRFADGDNLENDPSGDQMMGLFTSTLNQYLRAELGFVNDSFYKALSMKVNEAWDYEDFKGHYVNTSDQLRDLMARSPRTKVFVANGFYDLATPHLATEYTFNHMGLDESVRKNVRMEYYEAGHMMYVHKPSLERLAADLREFVTDTR
ncbi:MAG: peptidase S10 [Actinomycetota bacterium]|nr:peptidase S10 [Actinomycetota bacterium]